jgi:glycerol-3-phosphate acyltransferase PlsY
VIVAAIARYSSLAALIASAGTPVLLWLNGDRQQAQLFAVLSVLLWLKHAGNIRRLISGTEGKIGH